MHPFRDLEAKEMKRRNSYFFTQLTILLACFSACSALDCNSNLSDPKQIIKTITVDKSGRGGFTSIQKAIDSIPAKNAQWIRIRISAGKYKEKITVPVEKPCLYFQGADKFSTSIEWADHKDTGTSATVTFSADNIAVTGIAIKNTFLLYKKPLPPDQWIQAVAAKVEGDKVAFYDCAFYGVQDTLFDRVGRHYFKNCYIEGAVDFIFGDARSIYEKCHIYANIERYRPGAGLGGWIIAQQNMGGQDNGAFIFKYCSVNGVGKTLLGRAWGPYSTVIFANSYMSDVVKPEGWDAENYVGQEGKFRFVEFNNFGPGANTSRRVPWVKKFASSQLLQFIDISSINSDGWIQKLPLKFFVLGKLSVHCFAVTRTSETTRIPNQNEIPTQYFLKF